MTADGAGVGSGVGRGDTVGLSEVGSGVGLSQKPHDKSHLPAFVPHVGQ